MLPERPKLYDAPILGGQIMAEVLRRQFDGTVFNGANAVQVVFDKEGKVLQVDSHNLSGHYKAAPFLRNETDSGWIGEGGFYGDTTDLGKRLKAIVDTTSDDWKQWKQTELQHPGMDFRTWKNLRAIAFELEYQRLQAQTQSEDTY